MISEKLKSIIFDKLYQDLKHCEIISYDKSVYFIDRDNKYWYFELEKSGKLWWRYEFFTDFFPLFCLEIDEFQPLLSEWVEGILNSNINMTTRSGHRLHSTVEGILNHGYRKGSRKVDEVLNHKVSITEYCGIIPNYDLEEVLNREINELDGGELLDISTLEKVLNHKVVSIIPANLQNELIQQILVNELIYEVESASPLDTPAHDSVDEVLAYKVTRTIPDLNESLADVEIILNQKS
jgi:hypothetical protein